MFQITSTCKGAGYRYCRTVPPHPKATPKGLYPLHRVLMENKIGRLLQRDEHVHHKDGDKRNDTIANLELLTAAQHTAEHHPRMPLVSLVCPCGARFMRTAPQAADSAATVARNAQYLPHRMSLRELYNGATRVHATVSISPTDMTTGPAVQIRLPLPAIIHRR